MNKQSAPELTYWLSEMSQHADSAKRDADLLRDSRKKLHEETAMLRKTQSDLLQVRSQLLKRRSAILRAKDVSMVVPEKAESVGQYDEDNKYNSASTAELRWLANLTLPLQGLSQAEVSQVCDLTRRLADLTQEQRQVLFDWAGLTRGEQQSLANIVGKNLTIKIKAVARVDAEAAAAVVADDAYEAFTTAEEATRDRVRQFLGRDA